MTDRDNGGPAFPVGSDYGPATNIVDGGLGGMSLRDYFAAAALQGLITREFGGYRETAIMAYCIADAMLEAR